MHLPQSFVVAITARGTDPSQRASSVLRGLARSHPGDVSGPPDLKTGVRARNQTLVFRDFCFSFSSHCREDRSTRAMFLQLELINLTLCRAR